MTQALVTLGLGSFGSAGQVVLVGLFPAAPSPGEPTNWISFTAVASAPQCTGSLQAPASVGVAAVSNMVATGRPDR